MLRMHDIQRSHEIVTVALEAAQERGARRIERIHLIIGEMSLLDPDQVRFWVSELLRGTIGEGAQVEIEMRRARLRCSACGYEGEVEVVDDPIYHFTTMVPACPACAARDVEIVSGDECIIEGLIVEGPVGPGEP